MLSGAREAQGFTITIDPAFSQYQVIASTKLNTLLSTTFTAVKIEKCRKPRAITNTLSTPQTVLTPQQIPLTISPPMMSLKYWPGCLRWNQGYGIEISEPSD